MAKTKKVVSAVVSADAPLELVQTREDATQLAAFLKGLAPFFMTAAQHEAAALAAKTRALARTKAPATEEEDAQVVADIRADKAAQKAGLAHWTPVTSLFSSLHKRLTGARGRMDDAFETGIKHNTRLHAEFLEADRRRREAEAAEQRRKDEAEAARLRQIELDELDAAAFAAEAASPDLSQREAAFVSFYRDTARNDAAAIRAAQTAGYRDPSTKGPKLAASPKVLAALEAYDTAQAARKQASAIAAQPVDVAYTRPDTSRPASAKGTRYTYSAVVDDPKALIAAVLDGAVTSDILAIDQTAVNRHARELQERLQWPGVRVIKTPTVV